MKSSIRISTQQPPPGGVALLVCALLLGSAGAADAQACNDVARSGWEPLGPVANGPGMGYPPDVGARVHLADFDGDRRADYLLVEEGGGVRVWLNRGGDRRGGWLYRGRVLNGVGVPASRVSFADVDRDGQADYLVQGESGRVDAWINLGGDVFDDSGFRSGWYHRPGFAKGGDREPIGVFFHDFDGDGRADYTVIDDVVAGSLLVAYNLGGDNRGEAEWDGLHKVANGATNRVFPFLAFAHMSCDRRIDYVTLNERGALRVFINNGGDGARGASGGWKASDITAAGTGTFQVTFADFDGDGLDDYNLVRPDGSLETFLNRGGDKL